jgi:hypothetical protein
LAPRLLLSGIRRDLVRAAFCDYFAIGEARADLLIALYERAGEAARWDVLRHEADSHRPPTRGALQESIRLLRACMKTESIDLQDGGYCLTDVGLAECQEALIETATALAAMGGGWKEAA